MKNHNYPDPEKWAQQWISRRIFRNDPAPPGQWFAVCFCIVSLLYFLGRAIF